MTVLLDIQDGPAGTEWLSPAIIAGSLSATGTSFTPAVLGAGGALTRNRTYDFSVRVHNGGTEDAQPPDQMFTPAPFQSAETLVTSPLPTVSGGVGTVYIQRVTGNPDDLFLTTASGDHYLKPLFPVRFVGLSQNGKYIVVQELNQPNRQIDLTVYAAVPIAGVPPAGSTQIPTLNAGALVYNDTITLAGGGGTLASLGLGMVPGQDMLFMTWTDSAGGLVAQIADLRPGAISRLTSLPLSAGQVGQYRFSPTGEILAVIGQPGGQILLFGIPGLQAFPWARRGSLSGVAQVTVAGNGVVSLRQMKARGWEAYEISSGGTTQLIDSHIADAPSVQVNLWVDLSNAVFDTTTSKRFPGGMVGEALPPQGFIDRILAGATVPALIDANWLSSLPPAGQHFCAIAEAFTTRTAAPADLRVRTGTALNPLGAAGRQIAQRNLVVM
jgi:hypothetical protein